jgi:hypothetical protein
MDIGVITGKRSLSIERWSRSNRIGREFARALVKSVRSPEEATYLLEEMISGFSGLPKNAKNEVRNALIRVQVYCSINTNADPITVSKQHVISQTVEKLLFGSNILFQEDIEAVPRPAKHRKRGAKRRK